MRIFLTGQMGLRKKELCEELTKYAKSRGNNINVFNVGEEMCKFTNTSEEEILDLEPWTLALARRAVFDKISKDPSDESVLVINTHSCFRWRFGLMTAVSFDNFAELNSDLYIIIIDDCDKIYKNLIKRNHKFTILDVLNWREEEIIITESIAKTQRKPFYILGRKNAVKNLYKLIFHHNLPKVYASFPITQIRDNKEKMEEVEKFKLKLRKKFIVFDPYDLEEGRHIIKSQHDFINAQKKFDEPIKMGDLDILWYHYLDASNIIKSQIKSRDFKLIDQSDMIIRFIPLETVHTENGKVEQYYRPSPGSQSEITYAQSTGKKSFTVCESPERLSPWIEFYTKIFRSIDEVITYLKENKIINDE